MTFWQVSACRPAPVDIGASIYHWSTDQRLVAREKTRRCRFGCNGEAPLATVATGPSGTIIDDETAFERTPVPENKTKGLGSFLGLFAGEHVAATELLIGPLFVAAGVSAFDILGGLLLGNILAVA